MPGGQPSQGSATGAAQAAGLPDGQQRNQGNTTASPGALNDKFEATIASYDGMILRERDYIANRRNQKGSEDDVEQIEGPIFDEGDLASEGGQQGNQTAAGPSAEGQGNGNGSQPVGGTARQGEYTTVAVAAPPPDIPSGDDDDVVARQIREAAMRETDPKLREKLWEEYRKYKNQTAKGS